MTEGRMRLEYLKDLQEVIAVEQDSVDMASDRSATQQ